MSEMNTSAAFFPPLEPLATQALAVSGGHTLYVEECGNPKGVPVVFLHGGPGSGCNTDQRRLFDPARFRIILFDQRGAGRSTPKGRLAENTTAHQIADMELLREKLGIERWLVVGGSWGATLGVAYACAHPSRVSGMVLRAVFLGSADEWRWAFLEGPRIFRPELYRAFIGLLDPSERGDPLAAYGRRMESADERKAAAAAWVWHDYERALSSLRAENAFLPESFLSAAGREGRPATPFFEWHYMKNNFFLFRPLLEEAKRLRDIPGVIVQGRYDLLCPPRTALALHEAWGEKCRLEIIEEAGHAASEPGIAPALMRAIDELGRRGI